MLEPGDKILVAHRRLYEGDQARFLAGEVDVFKDGLVKVTGYTFVRDAFTGKMSRKGDTRTKIISLMAGTLIVYQLPQTVDIAKLNYSDDNSGILSDGSGFTLDVAENISPRQ